MDVPECPVGVVEPSEVIHRARGVPLVPLPAVERGVQEADVEEAVDPLRVRLREVLDHRAGGEALAVEGDPQVVAGGRCERVLEPPGHKPDARLGDTKSLEVCPGEPDVGIQAAGLPHPKIAVRFAAGHALE